MVSENRRRVRAKVRRNVWLQRLWRTVVPDGLREKVRPFLADRGWLQPAYLPTLDRLGQDVARVEGQVVPREPKVRILFGPSFAIHAPCFAHDRVLAYALRLRGAKVLPVYCDGIQEGECNCVGGVWLKHGFENECRRCRAGAMRLWSDNPEPPVPLSRFLRRQDRTLIDKKVATLNETDWVDYEEDGLPLGRWAKDIMVNSRVVGDHRLIPGHLELGRLHVRNLLLLRSAYERALEALRPDRVVSSDSYYGMWGVLERLAVRKGIPFYSQWSGTRSGAWCYAYNDAAMNLDFSAPWKRFSSQPLSAQQQSKVKAWLDGRSSGRDSVLNMTAFTAKQGTNVDKQKLAPGKPTALLAANVIWDLVALNKQILFSDMIDWIACTIAWFKQHPHYRLIVKPHPSELNPAIPTTEERVESGLRRRGVQVPENVILLPADVNLKVYDLFPLVNVGLVHTTTVGYEMAALGLPVITTARSRYRGFGFTIDPKTQEEYFRVLQDTLEGRQFLDPETQRALARKFILFQNYHYFSRIDIMEWTWGKTPRMTVTSAAELLPGRNECFDYMVDSIMEDLPIVSEDRWPPES